MLAIAAQIPSAEIGRGYFLETHPQNLFQGCRHACEMVSSPAQLPGVIETAIRVAIAEPSSTAAGPISSISPRPTCGAEPVSIPEVRPMIRCIRIWTREDGESRFEEGAIALSQGERGDILGGTTEVVSISFRATQPGGTYAWHPAPTKRFVLTLRGTLDFQTKSGAHFTIRPGDILIAEDTTGSGHSWRLVDDEPRCRAYVILAPGAAAALPFIPAAR